MNESSSPGSTERRPLPGDASSPLLDNRSPAPAGGDGNEGDGTGREPDPEDSGRSHVFSSRENKRKALFVLAAVVAFFVLVFFALKPYLSLLKDPEAIRSLVAECGPYAPLVLISLQVAQVLIAPIPGQITGLASGYLFGWKSGILYTMLGLALGSFLAFLLSRKLGRPFVERVIERDTLKRLDQLSARRGVVTLFLLFLLPAFPDDALCFVAGLTAIPLGTLMLIALIGRFPGMLMLNLVGSGFAEEEILVPILLTSILLAVSFLVWVYRKQIEDYCHRRRRPPGEG